MCAEARREGPATAGKEQQRQGDAGGVDDRDDDDPAADLVRGDVRRESTEHGPAAGDEDEAEAGAEQEAAAEIAGSATRHEEERALDPFAELRDDQHERQS